MISKLTVKVPPASNFFLIRSADQWFLLPFFPATAMLVHFMMNEWLGWQTQMRFVLWGGFFGVLPVLIGYFETTFTWTVRDERELRQAESLMLEKIHWAGYRVEFRPGVFRHPEVFVFGRRITPLVLWRLNEVHLRTNGLCVLISAPLGIAALLRKAAKRSDLLAGRSGPARRS